MRGDRRPVSPTELAQLARCEQQVLYDRQFGAKRSAHWQRRSVEGNKVHAELERKVASATRRKTSSMLTVLIVGLIIALLALLLLARGDARPSQDLLPPELHGATLEMSEKPLVRKQPVHIRGRPDEVW